MICFLPQRGSFAQMEIAGDFIKHRATHLCLVHCSLSKKSHLLEYFCPFLPIPRLFTYEVSVCSGHKYRLVRVYPAFICNFI